ncbi:hypothetical protein Btru_068880 [Bulinus truncatus]|nr:hypothetical protein Btru_068880 [Bulinus truncatus]
MMHSIRQSLKRNSHELEDSDECLPISKRIHSLHIEGQSSILIPQLQARNADNDIRTFAGFPESGAGPCSPAPGEATIQQHFVQSSFPDRFEYSNGASMVIRIPPVNGHEIPAPHHMNGELSAFSHSSQLGDSVFPSHAGVLHNSSSPSHSQTSHCSMLNNGDSHGMSHQHPQGGNYHSLDYHHYSPLKMAGSSRPSIRDGCSPFQGHHGQQNSFLQNVQNGHMSSFPNTVNKQAPPFDGSQASLSYTSQTSEVDFSLQQMPSGEYDPELSPSENPYYFSINQLLYEAHLSRIRRENSFSENS